jgi:diaminopropionate ammonia-lyase
MLNAFISSKTTPSHNLFRREDLDLQRAFYAARPELAPTPLQRCVSLAAQLGLAELLVKDETARFGLNAFKATGALFAVATLMSRGDIRGGDTLVCASEGNHGRAVARAAREVGCAACVYMSNRVAPARVDAIQSEGAAVRLVDGSYDDAVRTMAGEAERHGWMVVSDTSWPGYTEIPWLIMLGYTRLMDEVEEQADAPLDVIFVPAGVGGLLAAVACWVDLRDQEARPKVIAVEPVAAACVQASVRAGKPTPVQGPFDTTMGGLRCGEISPAVFPAVQSLVDGYLGIEDEVAFDAMRRLARPEGTDPVIECGPSGAAALGGLISVMTDASAVEMKRALQIGPDTRALAFATEGVTEPALFREVLARH